MTTDQIANIFGCTKAQVQAQLIANAHQLRKMQTRATTTGNKVNGYTADQLKARADSMETKAAA